MKNLNIKTWLSRDTVKIILVIIGAFIVGYLVRGIKVTSEHTRNYAIELLKQKQQQMLKK